jgi:hypothetical protein
MKHRMEYRKTTTASTLLPELCVPVICQLNLLRDYTTLLAVMSASKETQRLLTLCIAEKLESAVMTDEQIRKDPDPVDSLEKRVCKMFPKTDESIVRKLLNSVDVAHADAHQTVMWLLRIVRYAMDGTRALYERHDQEAGITVDNVFFPVLSHYLRDTVRHSIGRLYFNTQDGKWIRFIDSCMAPNFKSRRFAINFCELDELSDEQSIQLAKSYMTTSEEAVKLPSSCDLTEIATHESHSIASLIVLGRSIWHKDHIKGLTDHLHIYNGRPELFRLACWLTRPMNSIVEDLHRQMEPYYRPSYQRLNEGVEFIDLAI